MLRATRVSAVLERGGRIEAFANVWPGPGRVELSIDLMRHRVSAPKNVMDALFAHLMLWGKAQGYRRFSMGMAPLSGLEASEVAPLWVRFGSFVYAHGEAFYNFQGLRAKGQRQKSQAADQPPLQGAEAAGSHT